MKTGTQVVGVVGILLAASAVGMAQEERWGLELTPYFWAAGLEGDLEVQGNKVEVDAGFEDIVDAADAGGGLMAVATRGRLVAWGQLDYFGLDTDELDDAPAGGSVQSDSFLGALAVGRRFDGPFEGSTIDLMGGVRYARVEIEAEKTGVGSWEDSHDVVDAILVVSPSFRLTERLRLNPIFAVGAGDSDLTWEVQPSLRYQLRENMALRVGYRRLYYDYTGDAGNTWDAAFQGLIVGLSLMF